MAQTGQPGGAIVVNARHALSRLVRPLPQWCAIALNAPQSDVHVQLWDGAARVEVTRNLVVASLKPLTLAIGLDAAVKRVLEHGRDCEVQLFDRSVDRHCLGWLRLRPPRIWHCADTELGLFEVAAAGQRCVPWPYRAWNRRLQNRAMRRNRDPNNFAMPPDAVQQLMTFYICPRPVVLVSVQDADHSNIFPMDLIGPIEPAGFTLALRSTSVSIGTMKTSRRAALSSVPATDRAIAYRLGVHHKMPTLDLRELPFAIERSLNLSLPVPDTALRVMELEICDHDQIGSHTFFVSRVISNQVRREAAHLFHTSGFHQDLRIRRGRRFELAGG